MTKVKNVQRTALHESHWTATDENDKLIEGVQIFHTYKTFATANVEITTNYSCPLTTQQMDGIARRIDGRFRLSTSGVSTSSIGQPLKFRRYKFPQ